MAPVRRIVSAKVRTVNERRIASVVGNSRRQTMENLQLGLLIFAMPVEAVVLMFEGKPEESRPGAFAAAASRAGEG